MDKRANKFLLIGAIWLIFIFTIYYFLLARPGIGTKWKQEQVPPEKVSLLTLGMNGEILAQTPSGNLYELAPSWNLPWERFTEPAEDNRMGLLCHTDHTHSYISHPPPGKVISRVSEHCVASETGFHIEVVLLENGEVWSWTHEVGGYAELLLICALQAAFVLGVPFVLIGLGLKIRQWERRN